MVAFAAVIPDGTCAVYAFILVSRCLRHFDTITPNEVLGITIGSVIIAHKLHFDELSPLHAEVGEALGYTSKQIDQCEMHVFCILVVKDRLFVSREVFDWHHTILHESAVY